MTVESKIIVTAEDRTAATFAAIERNTGKTAMAMVKLQGQMLKFAGIGSLIAFFKRGAEATEKWRDEMARLDDITKKFFNTAADTGRIDPLLKVLKASYTTAFGLATLLDNIGLKIGANAAALGAAAKGNFAEANRIRKMGELDRLKNTAAFVALNTEINEPAPQGYAKRRDDEAERVKNAAKSQKGDRPEHGDIFGPDRDKEQSKYIEWQIKQEELVEEQFNKEQEIRLRESEARQQQRDKDIEALLLSQMTESDLLDQKYANDQQTLYDALSAEYITRTQFKEMKEQLELEHQGKMGDITAQGVLARRRFMEMNARQQTQTVINELLQVTQGVAATNKTMFNINKAAGIANAVMNTYIGVSKTLAAYPYPWNLIPAALHLAAGLAQVNSIRSSSFGSATSAPSISGGGAMPVFNADTSVPALAAPAASGPARNIYVTLAGSQRYTAEEVRDLIGQINEEQNDGVRVTVFA